MVKQSASGDPITDCLKSAHHRERERMWEIKQEVTLQSNIQQSEADTQPVKKNE